MGDHAATVQTIYGHFQKGEIDALLDYIDEDIDWEHDWGTEPPPIYRPGRGRKRVASFFAELGDYEFLRFEPLGMLTGGDMVAVPIHLELRHKPTGKTAKDLEVHLWTFGKNGKVTRFKHVVDPRSFT